MSEPAAAISRGWGTVSGGAARRRWTEHTVLAIALAAGFFGDALCVMAILRAAFIFSHRVDSDVELSSVLPWLYAGLGTAIFTGAFAYHGMYTRENLLDRRKQTTFLIEAWLGSSVLFFGAMSLSAEVLVSFPKALVAAFTLLATLLVWRVLLQKLMRGETITQLLRQRVVILGWSESSAQLARHTWEDFVYPCEIVGYVETTLQMEATEHPPTLPCLGAKKDLSAVLQQYEVDTVFLAGTDLAAESILELARICQTEMVEFKVIPSCFPALASGMHVEWVSGVPILGTDRLRMNRLLIRMEKRALDILGALVGLALFGPLIGLFCLLVYRESPGPVFYRQRRSGLKGRPFEMIKIRSMRLDAEKNGGPGWTVRDDPRRLKVGAFMRRWNIDELPQFWNVLKGEMSLVGPRPERPEFIQNLKHEITHYNLRHSVKPGLTGWAQVNGFRGNTDLSERIRHDLFYIDNWSALLDLQTMVMTLFKHKNAC